MKRKSKVLAMAVLLVIGCIGVYGIIEQKYEDNPKTPSVQKGKSLAMYIEDENGNYQVSSSKEFPKEGYVLNLEKSSCKNGGVLSQDAETKAISMRASGNDACNLYFSIEKCPKSSLYATTTLANELKVYDSSATTYNECNSGEMYTFDHEETTQTTGWSAAERRDYRYIGATPNNWVKFNGEDWRIVGVFTVETASGNKEQLIKIIRNGSIGNIKWHSSTVNEWPSSSLKTLLNEGDYYNRANTYASTGLNETAKNQIEEVKWYLGGSSTYQNLGGPDYYAFERGTTVYSGRSTNIMAKVGIMYPSDYIYTYANGVDNTCYTDGYNCDTGQKTNGWLFNNANQWTISPRASDAYIAFYVHSAGYVDSNYGVNDLRGVRPSVYLKSGIKIVGGDGASSATAYVLG